ncbi:GntR family transcriptional regulator [Venatoribacter cucullus]|uniref:GntR family transcriptional regulator n=1 Tax=Venatoribacter cucullus TaxID=2661630 RepID=A0A9X7YND2_9GAMM|nr:S1-like domain-containing RNA-binding protein [Venatoribacter cucullus]QQD23624.1 GntR family transcriptional regulator [Venatoribacter cucullus]
MAEPGRYHHLTVVEEQPHGLYLDDAEGGKVLLPRKQIPANTAIGDVLKVFVYLDSDDRPIATTLRPKAQLHQVAWLNVVDVNKTGAFLDWGLAKDLFVPFSEQKQRLEPGKSCAVYLYLDNTGRIVASTKLNRFIKDEVTSIWPGEPLPLKNGDAVKLFIAQRTELGYKAVVNNEYWGILYNTDIRSAIRVGQKLDGFIKRVREDKRLDLMLEPAGHEKADPLAKRILKKLEDNQGFLPMGDHSPADLIELHFAVSKRTFKMAIGKLLKERRIAIEENGIRLTTTDQPAEIQRPPKTPVADIEHRAEQRAEITTGVNTKPAKKVLRNPKHKSSNTLGLKK